MQADQAKQLLQAEIISALALHVLFFRRICSLAAGSGWSSPDMIRFITPLWAQTKAFRVLIPIQHRRAILPLRKTVSERSSWLFAASWYPARSSLHHRLVRHHGQQLRRFQALAL
eukprot:1325786-Pleurochrysis_carterae.AAC.2